MLYLILATVSVIISIFSAYMVFKEINHIKKQIKRSDDAVVSTPTDDIVFAPIRVNYQYPSGGSLFMRSAPAFSASIPYMPPLTERDSVIQQLNARVNLLQNQLLEAQQTSTRPMVIQIPPGTHLIDHSKTGQEKSEDNPETEENPKSNLRALEF